MALVFFSFDTIKSLFIGTLRESDVYGSPTFLLSQNDKPKEDLTIGRSIYVQVTMLKVNVNIFCFILFFFK